MANGYHTKQGRKSPNQVHVCWLCTCILWQDAKGCMEQVAASNDVAGANDSLQSTRVLKENQHFGKPSVQLVGTSIWLLVVKNGVCPGPKKLAQSVNSNYGHSTQLGDGKEKGYRPYQVMD
ncbi:unnamed protein product [Porites evermanni]|uniref:Uncharacterized protein n=1 Tax=Porites evermanni TaxID=104178 RepID=A0ABN8LXD7_9CNID|nr:unnamed protein product [Porites evermanni]